MKQQCVPEEWIGTLNDGLMETKGVIPGYWSITEDLQEGQASLWARHLCGPGISEERIAGGVADSTLNMGSWEGVDR